MPRACPACPRTLSRFSLRGRVFHACPDQDGILVAAEDLKFCFKSPELADDCLAQLGPSARPARESQRRCPECGQGFHTFPTSTFGQVFIDACPKCRVYWFDRGEWEAVKDAEFQASIPFAAAEDALKKSRGPRRPAEIPMVEASMSDRWSDLLVPMEDSTRLKTRTPVLTFMLIAFSFLATAMARRQPGLFAKWVYDPLHPFAHLGLPQITSLAAHVNFSHWLGNCFFLWLAGDDIEDEAGPWEFIKIFLLAGIAGNLTYSLAGGAAPSLGMSGAVAGLMAYYGIRFPRHRFNFSRFLPRGYGGLQIVRLSFSARTYLAFFILMNVAGFIQQSKSGSGINYASHVGGLIFGGAYALLTDANDRARDDLD